MPRHFSSREKEMIASALNYFKSNRENEAPTLPAKYKVAEALGISVTSVERVQASINKKKALNSPRIPHDDRKPVTDIGGS